MTLHQLIKTNAWPKVSVKLLELYPKSKANLLDYKLVYEELGKMKPQQSDFTLLISKEIDDDEEFIDVSGLHNQPKTEEEKYPQALEFCPWSDWLGMAVSKDSLNTYSELDIIAFCLYEMTFISFLEADIEQANNTMKSVGKTDEVKEFVTLEEVLNVLNEK